MTRVAKNINALQYNFPIMLKRLAIVAVFLAVAQAFMPTYGQISNDGTHASRNHAQASKSDQSKTPLVAPSLQPRSPESGDKKPPVDTADNKERPVLITKLPTVAAERDWLDYATFVVGLVVLGVGIVGVCYAKRTLDSIADQALSLHVHATHFEELAKAAKDNAIAARVAADAALLNAQSVIDSERAWLVVKIQKDPNHHPFPAENFINVLTNEGRTPAVFRSVHIEHTFVSLSDELPVPPVYGPRWLVNTEKTFFVGRDDLPIGPSLDPNKVIFRHRGLTGTEDTQEFFVWYGRIVYEDVFGTQDETPDLHETRWCYAWIKEEKKFVRYGPEEYNRNT